ncbi:MAG TPA: PIG-L family deacetylase [Candidatus Dormibacteraeota bacterium]|nr:PIG-L family deacetylase [Candidatus Dormibacteraeota bacterium]
MRFLKSFGLVLLLGLLRVPPVAAQFPPAPGTGPGLPETIEAIDSARVTTRILYITAHPDDESAAVLTYLARGLHADVALLTLTRGEGGQNALGPEQAPQLGLIRTQELLAATRGYGVKLYFTRARDFGYSKTPEETEKIWGDQVLEDMVRVIREFRPNIVINGWGGVHTGHGHHQVSGIWTPKAVALAADSSYKMRTFPQPRTPGPDEAPWNPTGGLQILDLDRSDTPKGYVLPLDDISPLYGKSYREIGLDAFVNHHSQGIAGFLSSPFLRRKIALVPEQGGILDPAKLAEPLTTLFPGCDVFVEAQKSLGTARAAFLQGDISGATHELATAANEFNTWSAKCGYAVTDVLSRYQFFDGINRSGRRVERALALAAGVQLKAEADTSNLVPGNTFHISAHTVCRAEAKCSLGSLELTLPAGMEESVKKGSADQDYEFSVRFLENMPSQSDHLPPPAHFEAMLPLLPEFSPLITAQQEVTVAGYLMVVSQPVTHIEATSTSVVRVPIRVVPDYTLSVQPDQAIEVLNAEHKPFDIFLRVHSYSTKAAKVAVGLNAPGGITTSAPVELTFDGIGDQYAKFTVTPPAKLDPGDFTIIAYAKRGDEIFSTSLEPLPSMPSILWSEPAQCIVRAFDINVPPHLRVAYISAEGEPIPDALKRLGIDVDMLDPTALNFGDLSKYDAIVVGVRAYELRPELTGANKRLLDYVSAGGTLVVQYNRDFVWDKLQPAPYSAKIGSPTPRVTDETAEVKFLQPADPLLNSPNRITDADFKNWVQERGLYYWSVFDPRYTPLLSMHDPGETDLNGGLVYTRYGQGTYIYTGLSFFRQLPEGNSGAYRLFVNLISASRTRQPAAAH